MHLKTCIIHPWFLLQLLRLWERQLKGFSHSLSICGKYAALKLWRGVWKEFHSHMGLYCHGVGESEVLRLAHWLFLQWHVSRSTCHHRSSRFINSGCWNLHNQKAKQEFPRHCINALYPCSKWEVLEDPICFHFLVYYFSTSLPSLLNRKTYRLVNFCPQSDH